MLGSNAKERERKILLYLYMNKPVSFNYSEIRDNTKIGIGVIEAVEDLNQYGFVKTKEEYTIGKAIKLMAKALQGKDTYPDLPRYRITKEGIRYIDKTEFNKGI